MEGLKFIIGLITFSIIATVIFFQLFKVYNNSFKEINRNSSLDTVVEKYHTMNGSIYINGEYSLPLIYNEDQCLCEDLEKGDKIFKYRSDVWYYRVRGQDTLLFR